MKVRNGFVSNSSVSSFIVMLRDRFDFQKEFKPPTKAKIRLLEKHGFYPCLSSNPMSLTTEQGENEKLRKDKKEHEKYYAKSGKKCPPYKIDQLGYRVVCNQDIPLGFLLYHDIPFVASVHYDHTTYVYKKGWDCVIVLNNFGVIHDNDPEKLFIGIKGDTIDGHIACKLPKTDFTEDYDPETIELDMQHNKY